MAKNVIVSEGKAKNFANKGTINDGRNGDADADADRKKICCKALKSFVVVENENAWFNLVSWLKNFFLPEIASNCVTNFSNCTPLLFATESVAYCKSSVAHPGYHKMKPSKCKCETNCKLAAGRWKWMDGGWGVLLLLKCINQNLLRCFASLFQFSYFGVVSSVVELLPIMQRQGKMLKIVFVFYFLLFCTAVVRYGYQFSLQGWPSSNGEMRASENVYFSLMNPLGNHNFVYFMLLREYESTYGVRHHNL